VEISSGFRSSLIVSSAWGPASSGRKGIGGPCILDSCWVRNAIAIGPLRSGPIGALNYISEAQSGNDPWCGGAAGGSDMAYYNSAVCWPLMQGGGF